MRSSSLVLFTCSLLKFLLNRADNNNDSKSSTSQRPKPDDICPIRGSHKWHFCIFNKDGPNYRPRARNSTVSDDGGIPSVMT